LVKKSNTTGSFKINFNLTDEQREINTSRNIIVELEMENDFLKHAALIMGQKSKS
jgi:transposase